MPGTTVLFTVTGPDRPGVSSVLFAALTRHGVDLLDVEQVVIRGRLTLGALVAAHHDPEALQETVEQAMASISMQVQTSMEVADDPTTRRHSSHVVVVLGRPITARAFASIARALADVGANIDAIRRVADYPVTGLELLVSPVPGRSSEDYPPGTLRKKLVDVARTAGVDVAVERAGLARRSKRLIVFDVDSTLSGIEGIDELAEAAGMRKEVSALTNRAMRGEIPLESVYKSRLDAIRPSREALEKLGKKYVKRALPHARELVRALGKLDKRVCIVSGALEPAVLMLAEHLDILVGFSVVKRAGFINGILKVKDLGHGSGGLTGPFGR